jgi:hypothetical protein
LCRYLFIDRLEHDLGDSIRKVVDSLLKVGRNLLHFGFNFFEHALEGVGRLLDLTVDGFVFSLVCLFVLSNIKIDHVDLFFVSLYQSVGLGDQLMGRGKARLHAFKFNCGLQLFLS